MAQIRQLHSSVIKQIAAGQVVDRPASIVKELVENALDAHATYIKIIVEDGGRQAISITDNGDGIAAEQVELACQSHTTSKIFSGEDLRAIASYGFRGEALASIALMSDFTLSSRARSAPIGSEISIQFGEQQSLRSLGMPVGTSVRVRDMFKKVPGRKKALKNAAFEFRLVLEAVVSLALAYPQVGFFVQHNAKVVLELAEQQEWLERVQLVLGTEFAEHSLQLSGSHDGVEWRGLLGKPQVAQHSQQQQFVLVNGRPVRDRLIAKAIRTAYGSLLEPRMHPAFILELSVDPKLVDVNVHPRKETVTFAVATLPKQIGENSKQTIQHHNLLFQNTLEHAQSELMVRDSEMNPRMAKHLKNKVLVWQPNSVEILPDEVLQIDNTYLVATTKEGIFLVDQHAAHERILYEQFLEQYKSETKNVQRVALEKSVSLKLPVSQAVFIEYQLEAFAALGFEMSVTETNQVRITKVPELLHTMDCKQVLLDVLEEIESAFELGGSVEALPRAAEKTLSFLACRSAIKAGDQLTQAERQRLLSKLLETKTQYTCPHGRPTQVQLTVSELEKLFHRR